MSAKVQRQGFIKIFAGLVVTSALLVTSLLPDVRLAYGYMVGLGLFALNALVLTRLAEHILQKLPRPSQGKKRVGVGVVLLMLAKLLLLAVGAFVALVVFDLSPWALVGGALAALLLFTLSAIVTA